MVVVLGLIFGAVLAIFVCLVVIPRKVWGLAKSWRFKNPDAVEPSELVVWWYRLSGVVGAIAIVITSANLWTDYRRQTRCDEVLPELTRLYATGGGPAVERRARALGLEVNDRAADSIGVLRTIVITDDGEPFATILGSYPRPTAYCDA